MSELVIVASDLYFAGGSLERAPPEATLPGLARMARFGAVELLPQGWRSWLAHWLGCPRLARAAPASVAASVAPRIAHLPHLHAAAQAPVVWLADPLNLTATLTSVHLSAQGLLRLEASAQEELSASFNDAFIGSGFELIPVRAGRFLARGPAPSGRIDTTDPARCLGSTLTEALPRGAGAAQLRRLGGEIEMWLHEHPINVRRVAAGLAPISTLWLWGGGASPEGEWDAGNAQATAAVFSDDVYVEGLSHLAGLRCAPAAIDLAALGAPPEPRMLATLELFSMPRPHQALHEPQGASRPGSTPLRTLESLDREWLVPALEQLARGKLSRVALIANDRCLSLGARDLWRRWRRPREALATLAPPSMRAAP